MRTFLFSVGIASLLVVACGGSATAQEKKAKSLQLQDLSPAVQKTVQDNLDGGQIKSINKEKEDGVEQYEVETMRNGKARDIIVDVKGKLLALEEATPIDSIPASAKAAILKKVGGGKLGSVETVTKPGQPAMYEADYKDKSGKNREIVVKADGSETKE